MMVDDNFLNDIFMTASSVEINHVIWQLIVLERKTFIVKLSYKWTLYEIQNLSLDIWQYHETKTNAPTTSELI